MQKIWPQVHFDEDDDSDQRKKKLKNKFRSKKQVQPFENDQYSEELDSVKVYDNRLKSKKRKATKRLSERPSTLLDVFNTPGVLKTLLVGKQSLQLGVPCFLVNLVLAMVTEMFPHTQRYNTVVLLMLAASAQFRDFPAKSVRPQIIISVITVLSLAVDIFYLIGSRFRLTHTLNTLISLVFIAKCTLLYAFLRNVNGSVRTRKYLHRRTRLFFIPTFQPRRIMRDVRGRFLAIGWMSLAMIISYSILYAVLILYFDYSSSYATVSNISGSISNFLVLKVITSSVILLGILYDTDVILCLWYFGFLACCLPYVRAYIRRKRIDLQGYPLVYSYAKIRFQLLQFIKCMDVVCGIYGWYILSYTFNASWYSMSTDLRVFYCMVILTLLVSDIHVSALFFAQRWLLYRYKVVKSIDSRLVASDDSEIEEFGLQVTAQDMDEENERLVAAEKDRIEVFKHYREVLKQDELRAANKTKGGRIKLKHKYAKHNGVVPWNDSGAGGNRDLEEGMEEHSSEEEKRYARDRRKHSGSDNDDNDDEDEDDDDVLKYLLGISEYDHLAFTPYHPEGGEEDYNNPLHALTSSVKHAATSSRKGSRVGIEEHIVSNSSSSSSSSTAAAATAGGGGGGGGGGTAGGGAGGAAAAATAGGAGAGGGGVMEEEYVAVSTQMKKKSSTGSKSRPNSASSHKHSTVYPVTLTDGGDSGTARQMNESVFVDIKVKTKKTGEVMSAFAADGTSMVMRGRTKVVPYVSPHTDTVFSPMIIKEDT